MEEHIVQLTLSSNTAIPQDTHSFPYTITHVHAHALLPFFLFLQLPQLDVAMAVHEIHHDDPLGNLRAMHAIS